MYKAGKKWYDNRKNNTITPVEKLPLTENAETNKTNGPMDTIEPPSPPKATEGVQGLTTLENEMVELTSKPGDEKK